VGERKAVTKCRSLPAESAGEVRSEDTQRAKTRCGERRTNRPIPLDATPRPSALAGGQAGKWVTWNHLLFLSPLRHGTLLARHTSSEEHPSESGGAGPLPRARTHAQLQLTRPGQPRGAASLGGRPLMWGRLSSLRPAFEPALAPFTHRSLPPTRSPSGASRQACHAGGRAGRATQSRAARTSQKPSAARAGVVARATARSTSSRRCKVEQAARLAMPAVAPAEQHTPEQHGLPKNLPPPRLAAWPARLRAPPQAAAVRWSKPPGLPCRRSRRQNNTLPSSTDSPKTFRRQDWRRGPHDCALHLKPPPPVEQAARLAMPAVAPAEQHNPEQHGLPKNLPPPRLAAWPARLRAPREHPVKCRTSRGRLESRPDQPRAKLSPFAH